MQQREKDKERWSKRYYNMYSIFYKHTILNLSKKNGLWGVRARQTRPIGSPPFWTQPIFLHFSIVQNLVVLVVVRCNPTQHCYINYSLNTCPRHVHLHQSREKTKELFQKREKTHVQSECEKRTHIQNQGATNVQSPSSGAHAVFH